jgi:amidophosphoribosyltransferase
MGVDMATYQELIAHQLQIEEIRRRIGADSLAYLSLEGMLEAISSPGLAGVQGAPGGQTGHCTACFSGNYPIHIPEWMFSNDREKLIFEEMWRS